MIPLELDDQGRLTLPPGLRAANAWGPGTRFSCEESHGVLILRALPAEEAQPQRRPRDADELVALRIHLGLTRSALAKRLSVDVNEIRAWEEGHATPDALTLDRVALLASDE